MKHVKTSTLLFGSVARNEAGPRSDVDVLLLRDEHDEPSLPGHASELSVHTYSEPALRALFARSALFALHLN